MYDIINYTVNHKSKTKKMSVKEKKPLSDAQKKKVADYYIKKRIESNIEEKRNAIIKPVSYTHLTLPTNREV